ncbi:PREDICTED: uncharacterized protein LOC108361006 [Rhagoletis zephyria]|uniref:uncharacterized protein LOC108361006 n=1 Tax=Rhagoletis zephyria TaxID=28612 RepID=UPI0008112564|nr:PREDICTED: uncharacterized protein LOC108361006 [Rhagoletis zephyria]
MPNFLPGKLESERGFEAESSLRLKELDSKKLLIRPAMTESSNWVTSLIRPDRCEETNTFVHQIIPYEIRLNNYNKAREHIFGPDNKQPTCKNRTSIRINEFWKTAKNNRKQVRNLVCSIQQKSFELRPYAKKEILGSEHLALLDSGAQVSCLGSSLAEDVCKNQQLRKHSASVYTADGNKQLVFGTIGLNVKFEGRDEEISFFVIPSMSQKIILGGDFWIKFQIALSIVSEVSLDPKRYENTLPLNGEQQNKLEMIRNRFPNFEKECLGKTSLSEYVIELQPGVRPIKQRYFPISPAVEKLVHAEIDEMLLGVIEESPNSPWSSPIALVKKPNKARLCLDSRKVNSVTIKDAYPLLHIDGILSRIP